MSTCYRCKGLRKYMGLGGMSAVCDCEAYFAENNVAHTVDKRSKEFKKAVKEMRETNPEMSTEKATELLEGALKRA